MAAPAYVFMLEKQGLAFLRVIKFTMYFFLALTIFTFLFPPAHAHAQQAPLYISHFPLADGETTWGQSGGASEKVAMVLRGNVTSTRDLDVCGVQVAIAGSTADQTGIYTLNVYRLTQGGTFDGSELLVATSTTLLITKELSNNDFDYSKEDENQIYELSVCKTLFFTRYDYAFTFEQDFTSGSNNLKVGYGNMDEFGVFSFYNGTTEVWTEDNSLSPSIVLLGFPTIFTSCSRFLFFSDMCEAMLWFFVPDAAIIADTWQQAEAKFTDKVPFGWWGQISEGFSAVSTTPVQVTSTLSIAIPLPYSHTTTTVTILDFTRIRQYVSDSNLALIRQYGAFAIWAWFAAYVWSVVTGRTPNWND